MAEEHRRLQQELHPWQQFAVELWQRVEFQRTDGAFAVTKDELKSAPPTMMVIALGSSSCRRRCIGRRGTFSDSFGGLFGRPFNLGDVLWQRHVAGLHQLQDGGALARCRGDLAAVHSAEVRQRLLFRRQALRESASRTRLPQVPQQRRIPQSLQRRWAPLPLQPHPFSRHPPVTNCFQLQSCLFDHQFKRKRRRKRKRKRKEKEKEARRRMESTCGANSRSEPC